MKILLLGHRGLLGAMVLKYLRSKGCTIQTTDFRWPSNEFAEVVKTTNATYIINCIGLIPQKKGTSDIIGYGMVNTFLPLWIADNIPSTSRLIVPCTDCEFSGYIPVSGFYAPNDRTDASDPYGKSKAAATNYLVGRDNVFLIRTSIIGPEASDGKSLWNWFVETRDDPVNGFTNHYWNGITTLSWAKIAEKMMWEHYGNSHYNVSKPTNNIIQVSSTKVSKYDILVSLNRILNLNKNILAKPAKETKNKCLTPHIFMGDITQQIEETYKFWNE